MKIQFIAKTICDQCDLNEGDKEVKPTVYLDYKNEKGNNIGGDFCETCFIKLIKEYLERTKK